jgi:hypothetical protein
MNITQWPKVLGLHVTLYIWVGVKSNWRHSHRNELQSSVNAAEQNVCITSIKNLTLFCLDKKSSLNLKTSIKVWNFLDITIKTSPPPRMSGIASAWTSVGKLFLRTINDFVFKNCDQQRPLGFLSVPCSSLTTRILILGSQSTLMCEFVIGQTVLFFRQWVERPLHFDKSLV